mgnify:CR=1 FL=1
MLIHPAVFRTFDVEDLSEIEHLGQFPFCGGWSNPSTQFATISGLVARASTLSSTPALAYNTLVHLLVAYLLTARVAPKDAVAMARRWNTKHTSHPISCLRAVGDALALAQVLDARR